MARLRGRDFADRLARAAAWLPLGQRKADKLTHRNALTRLGAAGFAPRVIYDVGAYRAAGRICAYAGLG